MLQALVNVCSIALTFNTRKVSLGFLARKQFFKQKQQSHSKVQEFSKKEPSACTKLQYRRVFLVVFYTFAGVTL